MTTKIPPENIIIKTGTWESIGKPCFAIRTTVFVEEQKVPAELELDEHDPHCVHVLACVKQQHSNNDSENNNTTNEIPVATARLLLDSGNVGRMAVLKEYRGCGLGSMMLKKVVEEARRSKLKAVHLHAQTHAIAFYAREGFVQEGEEFMEAGIPHVNMTLKF